MATSTKSKLIFGSLLILSVLLVAADRVKGQKLIIDGVGYEKAEDISRPIYLSPRLTDKELHDFYNFALGEYKKANFGSSKDLFEGIAERTDKYPMSWYYLAEIRKNIYPYSQDKAKLKLALINITKSNLNKDMKQSAYDDLTKYETDIDKAVSYGQKAMALQDNVFGRYVLMTAYYNAYTRTHKDVYRKGLADIYDARMKSVFMGSGMQPWVEEILAKNE